MISFGQTLCRGFNNTDKLVMLFPHRWRRRLPPSLQQLLVGS
jgi:hypothetical protein